MSEHEPHEDTMILFLCTGNIARSPFLEHRLRDRLHVAGLHGVTVVSAGTSAVPGQPMASPIVEVLASQNVVIKDDWNSQALSEDLVRRADLILTAEQRHIPLVAQLDPLAVRRTFTVRQLARLLNVVEADPAHPELTSREAVTHLLRDASRARGYAGKSSTADDVDDPWTHSDRFYRRVVSEMDTALDVIATRLIDLSPSS